MISLSLTIKIYIAGVKIGLASPLIGDIMKRIVRGTPVEATGKRLTNHSAKKSVAKKLDNENIPRAQIVSVTRDRNEKSLDDYVDSCSSERSKQLSHIISSRNNSLPSTSAP